MYCKNGTISRIRLLFAVRSSSGLLLCGTQIHALASPPYSRSRKILYVVTIKTGTGEWRYPNTVDMTIYRKSDIKDHLINLDYHSPIPLKASALGRLHQYLWTSVWQFRNPVRLVSHPNLRLGSLVASARVTHAGLRLPSIRIGKSVLVHISSKPSRQLILLRCCSIHKHPRREANAYHHDLLLARPTNGYAVPRKIEQWILLPGKRRAKNLIRNSVVARCALPFGR